MGYMEIEIIKDEKQWNSCNFHPNKAEFLQSWEWGKFKSNVGSEVIRLRLLEKKEVKAQVQGFVHNIGFGFKYLYIPRITSLNIRDWEILIEFFKKEKYIFLRIESAQENTYQSLFTSLQSPVFTQKTLQPQNTLVLNIKVPKEILLANMHAKTRYNIKLAERKGVIVKQEKNVDIFWELNQQTTNRDGFKSHDKKYYQKMLESSTTHQFTAYIDSEPIASNICVGFADTFTYLHGASGNKHRNLMAPYLLQWKQIEHAKENKFTMYDFWGVSPQSKEKLQTTFHNLSWKLDDKWTGITRFKAGFGGERKNYPDATIMVLNSLKYKIYKIAKKIRK